MKPEFKTAKEYIEWIDSQSGESWTNDTEMIAQVMEDYANMKSQQGISESEIEKEYDRFYSDLNEVIVSGEGIVTTSMCIGGKWYSHVLHKFADENKITHWQPLPSPPKQNGK